MPSLHVDFETLEALQRYRLRLATDAGSAVGISMNSAVHHLLISNPPYPGRAEPDALTYNNPMPSETIKGVPAQFVYQRCSLGSQYSTSAKDLYLEFQEWCKETGTYCPSQRGFGMQLTAIGLQRKRRNGGSHWWDGIRISGVSVSGHPKQQVEMRRPPPRAAEDEAAHHEEPPVSNLGHRVLGEDVGKFGLGFKTVVGRPKSKDEVIQHLLDGFFSGALDRGIDLQLSQDGSGRWISFPDNFMTVRLQPRNQALLVTAYGDPESFNDLTGDTLQVKVDRKPYSRFHVRSTADLSSALDIIAASQALRAEKMFGSAVEFDPMKEIDAKPLEQTCSFLMVPTGLGKTSLIGQQIRSLGADRCLIVTSSNAAAEEMQAQLFRRFALPFKVLDRTSLAEGANPVPYRDGKWLFLTTHYVFKRLLSNRGCERFLPPREGPPWDLVAIEEIQRLIKGESLDLAGFTNDESWWERENPMRSPTFTNHLVVVTTPHVLQRTEELDSISNLFDQRLSYSREAAEPRGDLGHSAQVRAHNSVNDEPRLSSIMFYLPTVEEQRTRVEEFEGEQRTGVEEFEEEQRTRVEEFRVLEMGNPESDNGSNFTCSPAGPRGPFEEKWFDSVTAVKGLFSTLPPNTREAFTEEFRRSGAMTRKPRHSSSTNEIYDGLQNQSSASSPLTSGMFDEGVLIRLKEDEVSKWESKMEVIERSSKMIGNTRRLGLHEGVEPIMARMVLVHTFAHVIMMQLAQDCGLPISDLRERLYVGEGKAAVLIYVSGEDPASSLGHVIDQSLPEALGTSASRALVDAIWCPNDPYCLEVPGQGYGVANLGACHACAILPQASCEAMNCFLDRGLLVQTRYAAGAGFFPSSASRSAERTVPR